MFGPRRSHRGHRRGYGRGGAGNFGLLLLGIQVFKFIQYLSSRDEFIPTTLVVMALNVLMFIRPDLHGLHRSLRLFNWPSTQSSCISVQTVWYQEQWERIILAPFVHGDSWHLYYNMASFMWKSRTLERHFGTGYYAYLTTVFTVLCSLMYLLVNFTIAETFDSLSYVKSCAVGFSGVIFAMKVVTTHLEPPGMAGVFGIPVPKRIAVWGELIVISVLFPRASFTGHLAGILVGLAFVSGPLKQIMDIPFDLVSSQFRHMNRATSPIMENQSSYTYTARSTGTRHGTVNTGATDEDELQEAMRRSLNDTTSGSSTNDYTPPPPYNPTYSAEDRASEYHESDVTTQENLRSARLRRFTQSNGQAT